MPQTVLLTLEAGNARFAAGAPVRHDVHEALRMVAAGMAPPAAILSCIDSRVPVETVFDLPIGSAFSARVAGNVVGPDVVGSLEFACAVAGSRLVVVLGHTGCGAVKGACDGVELGALTHRLVGVGVAAPFSLGGWHSLLGLSDDDAQHWNQLDLAAEVQAMTKLPVKFAKDTSAACVAELVAGRGRDLKSFLYLFVDTFVGGGLVIHSHLHTGVHGNAGAVASLPMNVADSTDSSPPPAQLIDQASLWALEQRFIAVGLEPQAAYDDRAMQPPYRAETNAWVDRAAVALAHCVISGTAFLDLDAVVIDGSMSRALLAQLITQTRSDLSRYNHEGIRPTELLEGSIGSDARALGGALLPLHANFAPDRDLFLKADR